MAPSPPSQPPVGGKRYQQPVGAGFAALYPGITAKLLTLEIIFRIPVHRELAYMYLLPTCSPLSHPAWAGAPRVGAGSVQHWPGLTRVWPWCWCQAGRGSPSTVSGTQSGAILPPSPAARLILKSRKGFVKLALQHGADLVPSFSFGEHGV
jgi:hypothetical protein